MHFQPRILTLLISIFISFQFSHGNESDRIPFYEDYLKDSDLKGFLEVARKYLEDKPEAVEAPRISMDYLMAAKAARDIEAIDFATTRLLFNYANSLPTLHFISSFEKGSKTLTELLIAKANSGNLQSKEFAVAYCRALITIARGHGPEFLSNPSLRLRAYLLGTKAEVKEIKISASKALELNTKKNNNQSKVIKIILSEENLIEKLNQLSALSGKDCEFSTAYYLAQLSKEDRASDEIRLIQLKQALFSKPKNVENALTLIASLPRKLGKQAKIQTYLGLAHYLDEKNELAINTLSQISANSSDKESQQWQKNAKSMASGIQFVDSRKQLFLESMGKAISQLNQDSDSIYLELIWGTENKKEAGPYTAFISASKEKELFEIHLQTRGMTIFAYRADNQSASIFSSENNSTIAFKSSGAIPIPNFDIQRDINSGGFNFNFNLNFAPDFESLVGEGIKFLENSYISTNKGRDVLLSYFLNQGAYWFLPSTPVSGGNAHFLSNLDPDQTEPGKIEIVFDLRNNLKAIDMGKLKIENISVGDSSVLDMVPEWPGGKTIDAEKFDFSLLMKIIKKLSDLVGS